MYTSGGSNGFFTKKNSACHRKGVYPRSKLAPVAPRGGGNTKPPPKKKRCNSAKKWCFTWHGSDGSRILTFQERVRALCVMAHFQEEVCPTTGAEHLQGFLVFKEKRRPIETFKDIDSTIHWEIMRGTIDQNMVYTTKDYTKKEGGIVFDFGTPRVLEQVTWEMLSEENKEVIKPIMDSPFDYRTIHWIFDPNGNWGKTLLQKYLVDNHNALMCAGAGKDMAYAMAKYKENNERWPDWVLVNLPKSTDEKYISYGMLEQFKDGLVFSGKYESCQLRFPPIKLVVFANMEPDYSQWSDDRLNVIRVNSKEFN